MDEESQIRAAVNERKQRARDLHIADNVFKLYRDHLRFLRADFNQDSQLIPKSVTKISKHPRTAHSPELIEFCIGEVEYLLSFSERKSYAPDDDDHYGSLQLKSGETLLLELKCLGEDEMYMGLTWKVSDIGAFIEGPWVQEINRFAQQVFSLAGQRNAESERARKQKEVADLKERFGL